jgi:Tfp pilus assembly protein PilN
MTATLNPAGHAVDERSLRVPAICAELLPVEIIEARRTRRIRRVVVVAVAGFAAILAVWYGLAVIETSAATDDLGRAQDNVQALTRQQRNYTELVTVQAESERIGAQLRELLADDLQWSKLLSSLQAAAPKGVTITGITAALNTDGAAPQAGTGLPSTTTSKSIGALTTNGVGTDKTVIAAYVDALGKVSGVGNPLLGDVTQQEKGLVFSVQLDITAAALGGRYAATPTPTSSRGTGGK